MNESSAGKGNGGAERPPAPASTSSGLPPIDPVLEHRFRDERQISDSRLAMLAEQVDDRFRKESLAAQREALAQKQRDDEAARDEARAKARKAQENRDRFKPLLFIVVTLAAWWLIIVLANLTITCVPGGAPCGSDGPLTPSMTMSKSQWVLTAMSVIVALWVSKMMVYPNRDFADQ